MKFDKDLDQNLSNSADDGADSDERPRHGGAGGQFRLGGPEAVAPEQMLAARGDHALSASLLAASK